MNSFKAYYYFIVVIAVVGLTDGQQFAIELSGATADDSQDTRRTNKINNNIVEQNGLRDGVSGLLALSLLGGAMALYSPKNRDRLVGGVDRSGYEYDSRPPPLSTYAQRVAHFENRVYNQFSGGLSRFGHGAKKATSKLRYALRRTGQRSLGVITRGANSVARMAAVTDSKLRGVARTAVRGLRRMGSGASRIGSGGIERMGGATTNLGTAAIRGLFRVGKAYAKGLNHARYKAFNGLRHIGETYKRGFSRVGHVASGFANAYSRSVARMGSAASASLGDVASDGVSRLGELATNGAATIGDLATDVADVATAVPKSITNAAKDKKIRDCLLQTICYVSTPFINPNSNYVKRSLPDDMDDDNGNIVDLGRLEPANGMLRMEDCEVFQCGVVSLGRKAYDLVASGLRKK